MVFVFDLDDTVCDTDLYSEQYILNFFKEHNLPYKQVAKVVRFAEKKFDWDMDTAICWYKEYGDEMMLHFPCKPNAKKIINKLYDAGHTIIIATARANDFHTEPEQITLSWLKNNGIKYSKLYCGRVDKEKICEDENANFFIDDDINITGRVASFFEERGNSGKCFLLNTDYNKTLESAENVVRLNNFYEFEKEINKSIKSLQKAKNN